MKRSFIIILCFTILFSSFLCGCQTEQQKRDVEICELAYNGEIELAKEKARKYYMNNDKKLDAMYKKINTLALSKEITKNTSDDVLSTIIKPEDELVIQDGYAGIIKDGYIYINGNVTNQGNGTISYYKITVKYYDESNNVVHSNYTNSGEDLYSGESREFEIMNKYNGYDGYKLFVDEVKFK